MIVSVHIPTTAGKSFQYDLTQVFDPRLLADYGNWPESTTPETTAHNEGRRAAGSRMQTIMGRKLLLEGGAVSALHWAIDSVKKGTCGPAC